MALYYKYKFLNFTLIFKFRPIGNIGFLLNCLPDDYNESN